jgi:hypothetical protein
VGARQTYHAYYLTYEPPLHPDTAPEIVRFLWEGLLPAATRAIRQRDGWDSYYYGNVPGRAWKAERGWYASDHLARQGYCRTCETEHHRGRRDCSEGCRARSRCERNEFFRTTG